MNPVIIVEPPRADPAVVAALGGLGVATVHEARAALRRGELSLDRYGLRPVLGQLGVRYLRAEPAQDQR